MSKASNNREYRDAMKRDIMAMRVSSAIAFNTRAHTEYDDTLLRISDMEDLPLKDQREAGRYWLSLRRGDVI